MKKELLFKVLLSLFISYGLLLTSCTDDESPRGTQFGIFEVIDDATVELDGVINSASLNNFNDLIATYPGINTINIVNCYGSEDDETNLQLCALVHQRGTNIHIIENGIIASGGTDFFLAGTKRTKGTNTRIGVHSWGGEDDAGSAVLPLTF